MASVGAEVASKLWARVLAALGRRRRLQLGCWLLLIRLIPRGFLFLERVHVIITFFILRDKIKKIYNTQTADLRIFLKSK